MWDWINHFIVVLASFLGLVAYFNAEKLRKRLNRMQDVLEEKGITNRYELIYDDETRNIIFRSQPKSFKDAVDEIRNKE